MHLMIPFAAPGSEAGRLALAQLCKLNLLPHLAALLAGAAPPECDEADAHSLSPPHERALARAVGLAGADGQLPWAAWWAAQEGRDLGDLVWGQLTPAHWHVGTDQITMLDPDQLQLTEADSRALLDAVQDLFTSEGYVLVYGVPTRWYLAHESLAGLATASPDRVIGRPLDPWLPRGPQARTWRRLQNEVQMRLHGHALNEAREARGLPPVNSLWLSGCGPAQAVRERPDLTQDTRLRAPALAEDWGAWQAAWQAIDAGPLAALRGQTARSRLTLCGEMASATWTLAPPSPWQRLMMRVRRFDLLPLLETL